MGVMEIFGFSDAYRRYLNNFIDLPRGRMPYGFDGNIP